MKAFNNFAFLFLCICYLNFSNTELYAQCTTNNAFKAGEVIRYDISYQWGIIWVEAGDVFFSVQKANFAGGDVFHFYSYGKTKPFWDGMFKVRDEYQSYTDAKTFEPYYSTRKTLEGNFWANDKTTFDYSTNKIYANTNNAERKKKTDTLQMKPCTLDLLTAIYYARNIDFTKLSKKQTFPFTVVIDNGIFELYGRYLGQEELILPNKKKFKTLKFSALLIEGTIFKGGEDMTVWVSDDPNHVPLLVDAKILIGSVKAYMTSYSGLKYPLSSEIK